MQLSEKIDTRFNQLLTEADANRQVTFAMLEDIEMEKNSTANYALRLPRSLKAEVERLAAEEGISVNQFIATAVAEKISAMQTIQFFTERKARTDFTAFDRIMSRSGGELPQPGDELPT